VPTERVAALRQAFDATMRDPAFLADAAKLGLEIDPLDGGRLQEIVQKVIGTPRPAVEKLIAAIQAGNDPRKAQ
jgi:hypothetical protein